MNAMMIGTLFEEEEIEKKKNFYSLPARDEKGRKRWVGAFTGGFTAGYKNTVGSKEGWAPSTFVSSRKDRSQKQQQNVMDFMDEEDIAQSVAGQTLVARSEYDTLGQRNKELIQKDLGMSLLGKPIDEMIVQSRNSVGYEILDAMLTQKKKEEYQEKAKTLQDKTKVRGYGIQIGPQRKEQKKERPDISEYFAKETNFQTGIPEANTQLQGLNINGSKYKSDEYETVFNEIFKKYQREANLEDEEKEEEARKKKNRLAMNNKNYEEADEDEDEDYYMTSKIKGFDRYEADEEEAEDTKRLDKAKKVVIQNLRALDEFIKDEKPFKIAGPVHLKPLEIPKDYDPYKKVKEFLKAGGKEKMELEKAKGNRRLNPAQRAEMLGERDATTDYELQRQQTKFANISEETRKKILGAKTFVRGTEASTDSHDVDAPFRDDPDKQERYKLFILEREGKIVGGSMPAGHVSLSQLRREQEEFQKLYEFFYLPKKKKQEEEEAKKREADKLASLGVSQDKAHLIHKIEELKSNLEKVQNQRRREEWVPDKILCRRFGVPPPHKGKNVQAESQISRNKFDDEILPAMMSQRGKLTQKDLELPQEFGSNKTLMNRFESKPVEEEPGSKRKNQGESKDAIEMAEEEEQRNKNKMMEEEEEVEAPQRPPMDLFKSIFDDESD